MKVRFYSRSGVNFLNPVRQFHIRESTHPIFMFTTGSKHAILRITLTHSIMNYENNISRQK